jgi:hypothetical protein
VTLEAPVRQTRFLYKISNADANRTHVHEIAWPRTRGSFPVLRHFSLLTFISACICLGYGKMLGPTTSDIFLIAAAASLVVAVILSRDG